MPYIQLSRESNRRSRPVWKKIYLNKETQKAECQVADCGKILDAKNSIQGAFSKTIILFEQ